MHFSCMCSFFFFSGFSRCGKAPHEACLLWRGLVEKVTSLLYFLSPSLSRWYSFRRRYPLACLLSNGQGKKTMREQQRQRCCGDVGSQISRNHLKETGFLSDARSKDFGVASPSDTAEQTTSELTVVCAQRCASPANTHARTHRQTRRSDDYHRQSPRKRSGTPLAATPSIWHADYKGERESKKEESNGSFSVSFIIVPFFFKRPAPWRSNARTDHGERQRSAKGVR